MRWLVEVSSLTKTDLQQFCVEAETWQRALQVARAQRGEDSPMSGFSIELLEEGYRAVDPVARMRFVVKRAPLDMPVTTIAIDSLTGIVNPPSSAATQPWVGPAPSSSTVGVDAKADGDSSSPSNGARGKAQTMVFGSAGDATVEEAGPTSVGVGVGAKAPGLPDVRILSSRAQDPTDASPMTYREYAFFVPEGTSEDAAGEVLRAQLVLVQAQVAGAKAGKLVNLAAFDVEFTGKPPRPLATLTWKDWKGDAVVAFPRRGGPSKPPGMPSHPPPSLVPPAPAAPSDMTVATAAKSDPAKVGEASAATVAPLAESAKPAPAAERTKPTESAKAIPAKTLESTKPATEPPVTEAPKAPLTASTTDTEANAVVDARAVAPTKAASTPAPVSAAAPASAPTDGTRASRPPSGAARVAERPRGRVSGDELITSLFESMHDLHFLRDALDGGHFCLGLATDALPSSGALLHFFDVEKREWLVACARGQSASSLVATRTAENDEVLRDAARTRRVVVLAAAGGKTAERYRSLGGARSIIVAPILQAGRVLGAIELINPLDGGPFTEDEGHAMTYIAEQYAEYIGSRGIVLDRDRIRSAAAR